MPENKAIDATQRLVADSRKADQKVTDQKSRLVQAEIILPTVPLKLDDNIIREALNARSR